jgi:hypothetical protein
MLVYVDLNRPTGIGYSLSGSPAYFIRASSLAEWPAIEQHATFQQLTPEQQESVRQKFPLCLERYLAIHSARFN